MKLSARNQLKGTIIDTRKVRSMELSRSILAAEI